jgi:hypothetical protein
MAVRLKLHGAISLTAFGHRPKPKASRDAIPAVAASKGGALGRPNNQQEPVAVGLEVEPPYRSRKDGLCDSAFLN